MKPKFKIVSVSLSPLARTVFEELNRIKSYGWFTEFVNKELIETYLPDMEGKVLKELIMQKQRDRDKLDDEIMAIANKLKKIKGG